MDDPIKRYDGFSGAEALFFINYFKSTKKLLSLFLLSRFFGKTVIVAKKWLVQGRTTFYCGYDEIVLKAITCLFRGHWGNGTFRQPFFWLFFVT